MTTETIEQQLRMRWGDEPAWYVVVTDRVTGLPVNITGATMRFTAKLRKSDPDSAAVFAKTVGSGITLTDPTNGQARVVLSDTDTTGKLPPGRDHLLRFDWRMSLSGQTVTVAFGGLLVQAAMSRVV